MSSSFLNGKTKWVTRLYPRESCRTQCSWRHACFVYSWAGALLGCSLSSSFSSILSILLSSSSILIMPHFSPSRLWPPPVLPHPRPPIFFVLRPPPSTISGCHWRRSLVRFRGCRSICSCRRQDSASGSCDTPSPPPPSSLPLFFFFHTTASK